VSQKIEQAIGELALEQPAFGQLRGANELRKRGLVVPPAGVRLRVAGLGADRGPVGAVDVGDRAAIAMEQVRLTQV
jgi:hypothetical protein